MDCQTLYLNLLLTLDNIQNSCKVSNETQIVHNVEKYVNLLNKAKYCNTLNLSNLELVNNNQRPLENKYILYAYTTGNHKEYIWPHLNAYKKLTYNSMHIYNNYLKF